MLLVTGASGRIGLRVATPLATSGARLRLMSRTPDKLRHLPGTEAVAGDFRDPPTLDAAFAGITTALVISGQAKPGERAHLHRNAFRAAARAGVRHVVYLSLKGSTPESHFPFCRDHAESETFLAETGLSHTILRIAFYIDMFADKFDAEGVLHGAAGEGAGAFISREDTAQAAAVALTDPPGGIIDVTGPELLSLADIARRFSALAGIPLRYQPETPTDMRARLARTDLPDWRQDLEAGWFEAIAAGEQAPPTDGFHRLTGRAPMTLEAYTSVGGFVPYTPAGAQRPQTP